VTRWFEDVVVNESFALGSHTFTAAEIVRFGKLYDPQYFHVDPEAARLGPFGGLVASGWHTVSIGHRLMVDAMAAEADRLRAGGDEPGIAGPSPGVNRMDFKRPVRPGDTITYTFTVTQKRPSASLPGWGVLTSTIEAKNQDGEIVYLGELVSFTKLRDYRMPLGLRASLALARVPGLGQLVRRLGQRPSASAG
jgi:acyl dehydratase